MEGSIRDYKKVGEKIMKFKVRKLEKEDIEKIIPLRVALQKYDGIHYENFVVDEEKLGEATRKFHRGEKKIIRDGNVEGKLIGTNLGCMMHLLRNKIFARYDRQNFSN